MKSPLFSVYGVHYQWNYSQSNRLILDNVSFDLFPGEIIALLGPNGCGKSTLLKIASGILPLTGQSTGQIRFRGQNFLSLSSYERAQRVVYVGAGINPEFPLLARDAVQLGRICRSHQAFWGNSQKKQQEDEQGVEMAMKAAHCWHLKDRLLENLSGGERQLVAIARALAQGPQVFFLDEALSQMDLNHQILMGELLLELKRQGKIIVIVAHDLNLALEWADKVIFLKDGKKVKDGLVRDILTESNLLEIYPNTPLVVVDQLKAENLNSSSPKVFFGSFSR